ncbi:Sterile alpha motif domain-containing protein [Artemisia annua]|uniref:Sterile alpha motif domain-containing protein n=1 Tax=Artemisia annua TaxID=35608 RepID=A0A2U1MUI8_ARTAN|nr:Sterile alpha motif domain-containing protein [Artemisia annua]
MSKERPPEPLDFFIWTVEDVGLWLEEINLGGYRQTFKENGVNGEYLEGMSMFTTEQILRFIRRCHMKWGDFITLCKELRRIKVACLKGEQKVRRPWWAPSCLSIVFVRVAKRNRQSRINGSSAPPTPPIISVTYRAAKIPQLTQGSMGMVKVNHLIGPLQPALSVDTTGNGNKGPMRPVAYQNSAFNSNGSYNRGTQSTYQDQRYGFDGVHSPIPWVDSSVYSNGMARNNTNTTPLSNANGFASKNQHFHTNSHLVNQRPMSDMNTASGYMKRMYPNKVYGRKGW